MNLTSRMLRERHKRVHILCIILFAKKKKKQAKLLYVVLNQDSSYPWNVWKEASGILVISVLLTLVCSVHENLSSHIVDEYL